jgi:hypothetical protein
LHSRRYRPRDAEGRVSTEGRLRHEAEEAEASDEVGAA